ncbi:hypothetical protein FQN54_002721 [Arachnomyces sp. PD_36]|nr:hypothetical protein FQN54_002721 [Arachnomyces sp. PD_36]
MSGIEIAAVALSNFTLAINALDRYQEVVGSTRMFAANSQLRLFHRNLVRELHSFKKNCEIALGMAFEGRDLNHAMVTPDDQIWRDPETESKMKAALGETHGVLSMAFHEMTSTTGELTRELNKVLDGQSALGKRLRFSIKSGFIRERLERIQDINIALYRLMTLSRPLGSRSVLNEERSRKQIYLGNLAVFRRNAQMIYKLFRDFVKYHCPVSDARIFAGSVNPGSKGSGFFFLLNKATDPIDLRSTPTWCKVNITVRTAEHDSFIPTAHEPPTLRTINLKEAFTHVFGPGKSNGGDETILLVHANGDNRFHLTVSLPEVDSIQFVTLREVFNGDTKISFRDQLVLSASLAQAVLGLHGTGLLRENFEAKDVHFLIDSGSINLENPLLPVPIRNDREQKAPIPPNPGKTAIGFIKSFGILLVEIFLLRDLSRAMTPGVEDDSKTYFINKYMVALQALEAMDDFLESSCFDAIKCCLLRLDFGDGEEWCEKLLERVVSPLERNARNIGKKRGRRTIIIGHENNTSQRPEKFPPMPDVSSPDLALSTQFDLVDKYATDVSVICRQSPWLGELIFNEVKSFMEVMHELKRLRTSVLSNQGFLNEIRVLVQECLERIASIPGPHGLTRPVADDHLKNSQLQLRVCYLKLSSFVTQNAVDPPSPTLSATTYTTDEESILDSVSAVPSSKSSMFMDDVDSGSIDSQAMAHEIILSLQGLFQTQAKSTPSGPDVSQGIHQALADYCEELRTLREDQLPFLPPPQASLYKTAVEMVSGQLHFIFGEIISILSPARPIPRESKSASLKESDRSTTLNLETGDDKSSPPVSQSQREHQIPTFVLDSFIIGGKAFGRLRFRLRRLLRQSLMHIIRDEVLLNLPITAQGFGSTRLHVQWDLARYVAQEFDGSPSIGQIFTITGGGTHAYASGCSDYLKHFWESSSYDICSHIQHYLEHKIYEHPDSTLTINGPTESPSGITVTVIGTRQTILVVTQQLAWLTAALRCPSTKPSLSDISFIATKESELFIEVDSLTELESGAETCWHQLIGNNVVASGFPIPPRDGQAGLELPLPVLLSLSRVSFSVDVKGQLILCGFSSLLCPTERFDENIPDKPPRQSIQWHFKSSVDPHKYFNSGEFLASSGWGNILEIDESTLPSCRHFVGYCRMAEIHLGTADCNFFGFQKTALPEATTAAGIRIKSLNAGTSGLGIFGGGVSADIIYPRDIAHSVTHDTYDDILETTKSKSMILWDSIVQCGWLVPAQAVLLHMAHMWIEQNKHKTTLRLATADSSFFNQVDEILRNDHKTVLRTSLEDGKEYRLRDLIKRFWRDIQACLIARWKFASEEHGTLGVRPSMVSGWELMDFIERPPVAFTMKTDASNLSNCGWESLGEDRDMMVLFCKDAGNVICPAATTALCADWRSPPKHKRYLIASLASLDQMARCYGGFGTYTRLSQQLAWRLTDEAVLEEICRHGPRHKCKKLQCLVNSDSDEKAQSSPLQLPVTGAVVFGKTKSGIHKIQDALIGRPQAISNGSVSTSPTPYVGSKTTSKLFSRAWKKITQ